MCMLFSPLINISTPIGAIFFALPCNIGFRPLLRARSYRVSLLVAEAYQVAYVWSGKERNTKGYLNKDMKVYTMMFWLIVVVHVGMVTGLPAPFMDGRKENGNVWKEGLFDELNLEYLEWKGMSLAHMDHRNWLVQAGFMNKIGKVLVHGGDGQTTRFCRGRTSSS